MKSPSQPASGQARSERRNAGGPTPDGRLAGLLGAMAIAGTLAAVRAWAWLTRTPFYKD